MYFARIGRKDSELSGKYIPKKFFLVLLDLLWDPDSSLGLVEELTQFTRITELNWLRRRSKDLVLIIF